MMQNPTYWVLTIYQEGHVSKKEKTGETLSTNITLVVT